MSEKTNLDRYEECLKEFTELSEIASNSGLEKPWLCWERSRLVNEIECLLEICLRIERLERLVNEHR